jgi:ATP-dependent Clp protease ATP-binding subunit ClpB
VPAEIDEVQRRVLQLEVEKQALKRERDSVSKERRKKIEKELADLNEQLTGMKRRWENERAAITRISEISEQIEQARGEAERAEKESALQVAAEMRYGKIPKLQAELEEQQAQLAELQKSGAMLNEEVGDEQIAAIVSRWTSVPVAKLLEGEVEKLVYLEQQLHRRVVGQEKAVGAVSTAVRRARAGLKDPNRPVGSFLFLGPTGVGKTELVKSLAVSLFDDEKAMVRLDMSEYSERHAVARMIGAPPGYVGYDEGGQLTEAIRRRPYSVILLDEIEKAHPEVFNILLQVLDDGRLTDGKGRTVDFRNAILIMTSNIASQYILEHAGESPEQLEEQVDRELHRVFRPEFLNRLDETIIFSSLSPEELDQIVKLQLARLDEMLAERGIALEVDGQARDRLARQGYDPAYGARPLKRAIQRKILDPLASGLLEGRFSPGDTVRVVAEGEEIVLTLGERVPALQTD